jgi:hypothetical protein
MAFPPGGKQQGFLSDWLVLLITGRRRDLALPGIFLSCPAEEALSRGKTLR